MKTIICKNCGIELEENVSRCPYCGTMNKKGAYREYRGKISAMIDSLLGIREDVERSVSRMVLSAFLRALIIIAAVILLAFGASRLAKVNYYNDAENDSEAYDDIMWLEANADELDRAYEAGDFATVKRLYYEKSRVVSKWEHYPEYTLLAEFDELKKNSYFNEYQLVKALYLLFYPEYYTGRGRMKEVDEALYSSLKEELVSFMQGKGFTLSGLEKIYQQCADASGYVNASDLKQFVR